jgi:hypothetical protein
MIPKIPRHKASETRRRLTQINGPSGRHLPIERPENGAVRMSDLVVNAFQTEAKAEDVRQKLFAVQK